jgi:ribosome-associated protein
VEGIKVAVKGAQDKKAENIVVQDLRNLSDICQFQMVCSGQNDKHVQAIANGIEEFLKKESHIAPVAVEGKKAGNWILMDYGHLIVHIFNREIRDYYALDQLWPTAKRLNLDS